MKRLMMFGSGIALLALALSSVSTASASSGEFITRKTIHVVNPAKGTKFANIDLGEKGPSIGDEFVFSGPITTPAGKRIGTVHGYFKSVSRTGEEVTASFQLPGGELTIEGLAGHATDVLAVTGGTRQYKNVLGQVTATTRNSGSTEFHFDLTLVRGEGD